MDEILLANFMVFHDVVAAETYDLWIGDEAWDVDYYLHENPELKTRRVRVADGLRRLAANARGRGAGGVPDGRLQRRDDRADRPLSRACATVRSSSATPTTSCPARSAPACPRSVEWTEQHFAFSGYITGFDQRAVADRRALRSELGYTADEQVCVVTVGGSGVGGALLRRVVESFEEARHLVPAPPDGRGRGPADRPGDARRPRRTRNPRASSPTCTGTSRRATWPSCRAG